MIIVTGCLGFIGTHLCRHLARIGNPILGIDNFDSFYDPAIKRNNLTDLSTYPNFQFFECDLRNKAAIEKMLVIPDNAVIFHLAALPGIHESLAHPAASFLSNVTATINLLDRIKKVKNVHFIFSSSSSVYGTGCPLPFRETCQTLQPVSPYGLSKYAAEQYCRLYYETYGTKITIFRLFTVYGPGQRPDMAITKFTRQLHEGSPLTITRGTMRDFVYIDDVVAAFNRSLAIQSSYAVINIGSGTSVPISYLVEQIRSRIVSSSSVHTAFLPPYEVAVTKAHVGKAKTLLRWQPYFPIEEGLGRFISWYGSTR